MRVRVCHREEKKKRRFSLCSPAKKPLKKTLSNSPLTVRSHLSLSPRAFCSRPHSRREKARRKKTCLFTCEKRKREEKCREPKFGRSQGKKAKKRFFSSCGRLNGAFAMRPPLPKKQATPSPSERSPGAQTRRPRGSSRTRGGKEKCKRPAGNGRGGKLKSDEENSLSLSPSLPVDAQLLPCFRTLVEVGSPVLQPSTASGPVKRIGRRRRKS